MASFADLDVRSPGAQASYRLLEPPDRRRSRRPPRSRTVVCGVERGEMAREVARVAAELSERLVARLVLVHVAPVPAVPGTAAVPGAAEQLRRIEAERVRGFLTGVLGDRRPRVRTEHTVGFGRPAAVLEAVAEEERADFIVVGSRGRGLLASALLGSVSAELARFASCPVVVIGPRARAFSLRERREEGRDRAT